jgi:hypothetical protein
MKLFCAARAKTGYFAVMPCRHAHFRLVSVSHPCACPERRELMTFALPTSGAARSNTRGSRTLNSKTGAVTIDEGETTVIPKRASRSGA